MFIPEFVRGILATIGAEILLLIGYAIVRLVMPLYERSKGGSMKKLLKKSFELWCKKRCLKEIDKEVDRYNHLYNKTKRQHYVLSKMINRFNEIYGEDLALGGKK